MQEKVLTFLLHMGKLTKQTAVTTTVSVVYIQMANSNYKYTSNSSERKVGSLKVKTRFVGVLDQQAYFNSIQYNRHNGGNKGWCLEGFGHH